MAFEIFVQLIWYEKVKQRVDEDIEIFCINVLINCSTIYSWIDLNKFGVLFKRNYYAVRFFRVKTKCDTNKRHRIGFVRFGLE